MDEAERILWQMLADSNVYVTGSPDEVDRINGAFALVVYGLSREQQVARADQLVECIQRLYDDKTIPLQPNTTALNAMLNLRAKEGKVDLVSNLLQHMIQSDENGRDMIAPNNVSFNCAVLAYAKRGDPDGASKVVRLMLDRYKQKKLLQPPDVVTFNGVLDAWTKSGDMNAGESAEEVLQWMYREQIQPDTRSYNSVIDAYAKSGMPLEAEYILQYLLKSREQGSHVGPDEFSFTAVVHAWATNSDVSVNSAERASAVIRLMEDLQDSGYDRITPAVSPYNALISAWAANSEEDRVQKVKDVLAHMKLRPGIVPNSRTHSSIITALAKSGERGVDEALEFLRELEDCIDADDALVRLDTASYNAVLSGLIRSNRGDAVVLAEQLRQRMVQREHETGEVSVGPNTVTYNSVMNILSKGRLVDSADRAEVMLNEMESLCESGRQQVKPSAVSYITCISAWARSNNREKVPRAQAILERMKEAYRCGDLDVKPTLLAYNALMNGCSFPVGGVDERAHAVSVVMDTLRELRDSDHVHPDHITYATALKAFGRCVPPGKSCDELVEQEFENCCVDGQVNDFVLRELQQASIKVYRNHFGNEDPRNATTNIPRQWRRNVSSRGKQRSR